MIRETSEIQCDRCGRYQSTQQLIVYRTSGLMPSFVAELETAGWKFIRDEEYKLVRVLCWHCAEKDNQQ